MTWEVQSPEEMIALGREVGASAPAGTVIGLCGQLGAGKTHFTKGLVGGVGGDPAEVTSPTFALAHEYRSVAHRLPIVHFDFYRMEEAEEVIRMGWDEYLDENDGVIVVEWADKFAELLPPETEWWTILITEGDSRKIERIVRDNSGSAR